MEKTLVNRKLPLNAWSLQCSIACLSIIEFKGEEITFGGGSVGVPVFVDEKSSADFRKIQLTS